MSHIILGLDTSSVVTGWAKIEWTGKEVRWIDSGTFRVIPSRPLGQRLHDFRERVDQLLGFHPSPTVMAIEKSHIRFIKTAVTLAKFIGIAEELAWAHGLRETAEINASRVRRLIGSKSKEETQKIVNEKFGLKITILDESDALAVAWASPSEIRKWEPRKPRKKPPVSIEGGLK
jgi:Holliday junction resolvasome RuvABC endonuclease subunit